MEKFFKIKERGSTLKTEIFAGITTFFAKAYIIFVNPNQVAAEGANGWLVGLGADPGTMGQIWNSVYIASIIVAIIGTLLMAFVADMPFAQACGMGLNSFFCTIFVAGSFFAGEDVKTGYQAGLVIVFLSGIVFLLLSVTGLRKYIAVSMPECLKKAIPAGIGLFIAFLGFQNVGIIQTNQYTLDQFVDIHGALQAIGLALLVLFFVVGVMRTCGNFAEVKKPEHALKLFIRFALAKGVVTYGLELMMALFNIVQGAASTIMNAAGFGSATQTVLPQEIVTAVEDCGFFESIPLWAGTLIGGLFITILSFIMIMSVYGRFFKLYLYTAIAPIPLSTFAGEPRQSVGKSFIKSYAAVCLEGAIIVLACIIFSLFAAAPPAVNPDAAAVSMVWSYIGELVFNMLVLVGAVKMADRVVREMMGL